jgi:hypothetical protein
MKENGYDMQAQNTKESPSEQEQTLSEKMRVWIYQNFKDLTNKLLLKVFLVGLTFSMLLPAILNLSVSRYRESIGDYCKDRTKAETIVIAVEMVILIIPDIVVLLFFIRKNIAKSIKKMVSAYIFGWIIMLVINSLLPQIKDIWIYKYGAVIGLLIPFLLETSVILYLVSKSNNRVNANRSGSVSSTETPKRANFRQILTYKNKEGKKEGKELLFQFIASQRFSNDYQEDDNFKKYANNHVMCLSSLYDTDPNDKGTIIGFFCMAYPKYFMTENEDPVLSFNPHIKTSDFPIFLEVDVKKSLVEILTTAEKLSWFLEHIDTSKVISTFNHIQRYLEDILSVYTSDDFFRTPEFIRFITKIHHEEDLELSAIDVK